jgi:hypothetical protein
MNGCGLEPVFLNHPSSGLELNANLTSPPKVMQARGSDQRRLALAILIEIDVCSSAEKHLDKWQFSERYKHGCKISNGGAAALRQLFSRFVARQRTHSLGECQTHLFHYISDMLFDGSLRKGRLKPPPATGTPVIVAIFEGRRGGRNCNGDYVRASSLG